MPRILGIDPGPTHSAIAIWDGAVASDAELLENESVFDKLFGFRPEAVAIEQIRGFGLRVGNETFDSCEWVGRFHQFCKALLTPCYLVPRKTVVVNLCGHARAGDKEVREALVERIGIVGTKKSPGPLLNFTSNHTRSALAVAVTYHDSLARPDVLKVT